jgi:threonine synthase
MSGEAVTSPAAGSQDGRKRMAAGRPGGLSAIGGTPVARLAHLADDGCAEVWVKMEAANPTGSYKDRMALAMIEAAEADGRCQPPNGPSWPSPPRSCAAFCAATSSCRD